MDIGLVCDSCDLFSPFGTEQCACGVEISLEVKANKAKAKGRKTMFYGAMQAARAKLVVISGDGQDGVAYNLAGEEHLAGRGPCALSFPDDIYLSPTHANFMYRDQKLIVRDEGSVNGIYLRVQGEIEIETGCFVLVGQECLRIDSLPELTEPELTNDGTYFYATPTTGQGFLVTQMLAGGTPGQSFFCVGNCSVGREENTINFPDDPFISGSHAHIGNVGTTLKLSDLNSKNGTFVKIREEQELRHGDYIFMGQQLLRVEIV